MAAAAVLRYVIKGPCSMDPRSQGLRISRSTYRATSTTLGHRPGFFVGVAAKQNEIKVSKVKYMAKSNSNRKMQ